MELALTAGSYQGPFDLIRAIGIRNSPSFNLSLNFTNFRLRPVNLEWDTPNRRSFRVNFMGIQQQTSAGGVAEARPEIPRAGGGSTPTSALPQLKVRPVPFRIAKAVLVRHHYLKSMPGGTQLALGVFVGTRLQGVLTLGVGPPMVFRLVDGADPSDCATLSRLWLSDALPRNSESIDKGADIEALDAPGMIGDDEATALLRAAGAPE